jgi:hypothetical protein
MAEMKIDTSGWGPFDPSSADDQMCERERVAFTAYTLKRLKKQARTCSDDKAIFVGGIMAIVQIVYAMHDNQPSDAAREAIHQTLDFAWLQCAGIAMNRDDLQ